MRTAPGKVVSWKMPSVFHLDTRHCRDTTSSCGPRTTKEARTQGKKEGILRLNWGPKRQNSEDGQEAPPSTGTIRRSQGPEWLLTCTEGTPQGQGREVTLTWRVNDSRPRLELGLGRAQTDDSTGWPTLAPPMETPRLAPTVGNSPVNSDPGDSSCSSPHTPSCLHLTVWGCMGT